MQQISNEDAYTICERVNYDWPTSWNIATRGFSEINTNLVGDDSAPDCAVLFAE